MPNFLAFLAVYYKSEIRHLVPTMDSSTDKHCEGVYIWGIHLWKGYIQIINNRPNFLRLVISFWQRIVSNMKITKNLPKVSARHQCWEPRMLNNADGWPVVIHLGQTNDTHRDNYSSECLQFFNCDILPWHSWWFTGNWLCVVQVHLLDQLQPDGRGEEEHEVQWYLPLLHNTCRARLLSETQILQFLHRVAAKNIQVWPTLPPSCIITN